MILTPKRMKEWTTSQWILFFTIVIFIVFLVIKQFIDYPKQFNSEIVYVYGFYVFSVALIITTLTFILNKTHVIHLHHYFMGMVYLPLVSVQDKMNLVILAMLYGMMIEGAAKWGLDPIWKEKKELPTD